MIADSSSRLQRSGTGGSLATALRDRGPCVIPVQPNRSLPIRPAPPTPTRSAASIVTSRKMRSPILKLPKLVNMDVVEVRSEKSPSGANETPFEQQGKKSDGTMRTSELIDRTDYTLPGITNVVQVVSQSQRSRTIFTATLDNDGFLARAISFNKHDTFIVVSFRFAVLLHS